MKAQLLTLLAFFLFSLPVSAFADDGSITGKVAAKKDKWLEGTVVYLANVPGEHEAPDEPVVMDQEDQKFVPHVLPIVAGTAVRFENSDNTGHNVFSPEGDYDLGVWGKGESKSHTFEKPGVYTQLCRLHPSMAAIVLVFQNPYFAKVGPDGEYEIENVPAGTYTLKVWNERRSAKKKKISVTSGKKVKVNFRLR